MTKKEDKTTLNFPLEEDKIEIPHPKQLPNKQQVRLLFPYALRQEVKKSGGRWDANKKFWYYPSVNGDLPESLRQYKCYDVHIEYEDKEYWKQQLDYLKWDSERKIWMVNEKDYQTFLSV